MIICTINCTFWKNIKAQFFCRGFIIFCKSLSFCTDKSGKFFLHHRMEKLHQPPILKFLYFFPASLQLKTNFAEISNLVEKTTKSNLYLYEQVLVILLSLWLSDLQICQFECSAHILSHPCISYLIQGTSQDIKTVGADFHTL